MRGNCSGFVIVWVVWGVLLGRSGDMDCHIAQAGGSMMTRVGDRILRHPPVAHAGKVADGARAYPPYDFLFRGGLWAFQGVGLRREGATGPDVAGRGYCFRGSQRRLRRVFWSAYSAGESRPASKARCRSVASWAFGTVRFTTVVEVVLEQAASAISRVSARGRMLWPIEDCAALGVVFGLGYYTGVQRLLEVDQGLALADREVGDGGVGG